ncbi:hypothetical protein HPP92_013825 [Vanilla planifolia]|uniref:RRM domain-containing protein n=1 Tax=Vanilla planifolia TaxID=51239 RepID=A0A835QT14_VANPL|nr:hypothetical protein HPP92_013825 [Vanilla planifolia]
MAACQLASIGPVPVQPPVMHVSEYTQRKIYVSNVGVELDPQKVLQFFSKFGEIEEGPLGVDKATGHILHCQKAIDGPKPTKLGVPLAHGVVQYAGLQQSASVYGPRVTQVGRSDGAVLIGGLNSSVGGPGHLIAPPAASLAGLGVSNGGHAIKSAIGNQVGGTGGYVKPGLISGYGASAQMIGSYGGAVMGQASSRTQPGLGHMGGVGAYLECLIYLELEIEGHCLAVHKKRVGRKNLFQHNTELQGLFVFLATALMLPSPVDVLCSMLPALWNKRGYEDNSFLYLSFSNSTSTEKIAKIGL